MRSEIKRWGNSAAIRLPRGILAEARLDVSSSVTVVVEGRKNHHRSQQVTRTGSDWRCPSPRPT